MDKDETERINAQNDVKEQAWSIRKQTDAVLKLTKVVLNNLSEKERELLEKMSAKDIKTYVKFKAHKNRLKLAKLKKQNIIQSFKRYCQGYLGKINLKFLNYYHNFYPVGCDSSVFRLHRSFLKCV